MIRRRKELLNNSLYLCVTSFQKIIVASHFRRVRFICLPKAKKVKKTLSLNVTVNLEIFNNIQKSAKNLNLGGPCTVEDSFEPLGVEVSVTRSWPSHLTNHRRINNNTQNTVIVNMMFYSINLFNIHRYK